MAINKYFPFAFVYFFANSVGLPYGLTYMTLLCPFFYFWVVAKQKKEPLLPFLLLLSPFILIHLSNGVDVKAYFFSFLNVIGVYMFCRAVYLFARNVTNPEKIFDKLLYINFILCLIAIPFYFTKYYHFFWIEQFLTQGITAFRRLKMFTYEASYYATLFIPIFYFYFLQLLFNQNRIKFFRLTIMITLPLIMSFSLGVISAVLFSVMFLFLVYAKLLIKKKRIFWLVILSVTSVIAGVVFLLAFFPDNVLFVRIGNIFSGNDSSGKGRTFEAFHLARLISAMKSEYWGIGFGQLKIIGEQTIRDFYNYDANYVISIPNTTAETVLMLGWVGLGIRIFVELFLFIYTKVWTNYYRFLLFFFIFIYQFTGSFITNITEYVIWILAFTNMFSQYDLKNTNFSAPPKHIQL
jgi:hypothetical protein